MDDVYQLMMRKKRNNESFSDLIRRSLTRKDIASFAGALQLSDEKVEEMKKNIRALRKKGTQELRR